MMLRRICLSTVYNTSPLFSNLSAARFIPQGVKQIVRSMGGSAQNELTFESNSAVRQILQPFTRNSIPQYEVSINNYSKVIEDDDLVIILFESKNGMNHNDLMGQIPQNLKVYGDLIKDAIESGLFEGKSKSKVVLRVPCIDNNKKWKNIALIGGELKEDAHLNKLKYADHFAHGRIIGDIIKETKAINVAILLRDSEKPAENNRNYHNLLLGVDDSLYNDSRFKVKKPDDRTASRSLKRVSFLSHYQEKNGEYETLVKQTSAISKGIVFAKDLVNAPPNCKTPGIIAGLTKHIFKNSNRIECNILGYEECKSLGMEGYLAVQQGSKHDPEFIHLKYKAQNPNKTPYRVVLIGKGLTFDSGGYNIKSGPASMIELMKFDMGGCAAILGCALAISELPLKNIEVDFISPVCENMVDANAMRPGDIIKYRNGKSVEILNTDAEGRLCLADALIYAQNNIKYEDGANNIKPDVILDLATLTGACMIALGDKYAGLYTSSTELRDDLINASFSANEKVWHMPLEPEYKENIKGKTADLKNIGGPYGGSITAALFLQEFIDPSLSSTKWAHIDMAGPVWNMSESKATGFGVKLLVEYLLKLQQKQN